MMSKWRKIVAAIKSAAHNYHYSHPAIEYPQDCESCMHAAYRNLETDIQENMTKDHFKWLLRRRIAELRERKTSNA